MADAAALSPSIAATVQADPAYLEQPAAHATLTVENMNCGSCVGKIERALAAAPGVFSARANLGAKRVAVAYSARATGVKALLQTLERSGFRAAELAPDAPAEDDPRSRDLLIRLGVAGFAAMNIMLLSVSIWSGGGGDMDGSTRTLFQWLSALIALPAVAYAGTPFYASAKQALKARRLNMDVPISLAILLATAMSLYQTSRGTEQVYFDAATSLLFFLLAGRYLDQKARAKALGAAQNLLSLKAPWASVVTADGTMERVASRELLRGMLIAVAPGERLAADGVVRSGESAIDEGLITGETVPRIVRAGDAVYAGTVNLGVTLRIEVRAAESGTLIAEIARLMEAAEQARGRYVRLADRAARIYAPAVHSLALATFLGWLAAGAGWEAGLTAAIAVLIITCPCALALAVPAVQVAASSRLFGKGLLLKAPDGLERLAEIDTVVFDKTGTLTLGRPALKNNHQISDETLSRAAALAASSRHPYAVAVAEAARGRLGGIADLPGVTERPGAGLVWQGPDGEERLGSAAWCGAGASEAESASLWYARSGAAPVAFHFEDRLREDARAVIRALEAAGFHVELLSGDRPGAVAEAADQAGIAIWRAGYKPGEKIARLEALKAEGRRVLMVGDGLNDAPALAAAHASLSPSTAADIAQTASDAVFQGGKLGAVLELLATARAAQRMAFGNFAIAALYNAVFVPLAMAGLATPLIAAIAMSTSSILVTLNALRLRGMRLELKP